MSSLCIIPRRPRHLLLTPLTLPLSSPSTELLQPPPLCFADFLLSLCCASPCKHRRYRPSSWLSSQSPGHVFLSLISSLLQIRLMGMVQSVHGAICPWTFPRSHLCSWCSSATNSAVLPQVTTTIGLRLSCQALFSVPLQTASPKTSPSSPSDGYNRAVSIYGPSGLRLSLTSPVGHLALLLLEAPPWP